MIPVPLSARIRLNYREIERYATFSSEKEKEQYIFLLKKEMNIIIANADILSNKAKKVYDIYVQ